ncbi:MAG: hypothetical protein DHS20C12_25410 [Pseudohongiella sp.]|nr:MAG: hypothetical protein DHS20C12_25410 [Pseudohongiella sp.]
MKTITCIQLGGACDEAFQADSFEEVAELSKRHAMEMFQKEDSAHIQAGNKMRELMQEPGAMERWMESKRAEFDALPDD